MTLDEGKSAQDRRDNGVKENLNRTSRSFRGRGLALAERGTGFLVSLLLISTLCFASGSTNGAPEQATTQPGARGSGITYSHDEVPEVPWSIHLVKIDRTRTDLQFETTMGAGDHFGMSIVSDQVKNFPTNLGHPLAAINGDFYKNDDKYPGDPHGLQIRRGELVSAPDDGRSCFWIDAAGNPRITNVMSRLTVTLPGGKILPIGLNEERTDGTAVLYTAAKGSSTRTSGGVEFILTRGDGTNWLPLAAGQTYAAKVEKIRREGDMPLTPHTMVLSVSPKVAAQAAGVKVGDILQVTTATSPGLAGATTAIGGGPALVHGRKKTSFGGIQPRHPRSALGWNKDYFYLVEVDGRQRISAGMTFPELATYMLNLGCDEAMNLDGGGSATIWVYGNVANHPSEGQERPAANALVVVRKDHP